MKLKAMSENHFIPWKKLKTGGSDIDISKKIFLIYGLEFTKKRYNSVGPIRSKYW
jgi:hypothetical protein